VSNKEARVADKQTQTGKNGCLAGSERRRSISRVQKGGRVTRFASVSQSCCCCWWRRRRF
jgi:hypothetical protein